MEDLAGPSVYEQNDLRRKCAIGIKLFGKLGLGSVNAINEKLQRIIPYFAERYMLYRWWKPNGAVGLWRWKLDGSEWYWLA